jgi:hypothetical protein
MPRRNSPMQLIKRYFDVPLVPQNAADGPQYLVVELAYQDTIQSSAWIVSLPVPRAFASKRPKRVKLASTAGQFRL